MGCCVYAICLRSMYSARVLGLGYRCGPPLTVARAFQVPSYAYLIAHPGVIVVWVPGTVGKWRMWTMPFECCQRRNLWNAASCIVPVAIVAFRSTRRVSPGVWENDGHPRVIHLHSHVAYTVSYRILAHLHRYCWFCMGAIVGSSVCSSHQWMSDVPFGVNPSGEGTRCGGCLVLRWVPTLTCNPWYVVGVSVLGNRWSKSGGASGGCCVVFRR